jgi:tetratricopeptide (TPR) repeat protein
MKFILFAAATMMLLASCGKNNALVKERDIKPWLDAGRFQQQKNIDNADLGFWEQKLQSDPGNHVFMTELARRYNRRFKQSGEVQDVLMADSLYRQSNNRLGNKNTGLLQARSQQAITLHRFHDARGYNELAAQKGALPRTVAMLRFDSDMELGDYDSANLRLNQLQQKKPDFDYLIRLAKYEDHAGRLPQAVSLMETAYNSIRKTNNKEIRMWLLSNLADMYGHAGRLEESRDAYYKVLSIDSVNLHALRGLAWISYSHDGDYELAETIIRFIMTRTKSPDYHLTLSEVLESKGEIAESNRQRQLFVGAVTKKEYGGMYHQYLIDLFNSDAQTVALALQMANEEMNNRTTPETYSWLAYSYFKNGQLRKAKELVEQKVTGKTFEPAPLSYAAEILAAAGCTQQAADLYRECETASFELGPLKAKQIRKALETLEQQHSLASR